MRMPSDLGPFHIIGIGGIGMSAIAEILTELGYTVQGSDGKESANVRRLREKGLRVFIGHDPVNLIGAETVVLSSAIKDGNIELEVARRKGIPVIRRAEMLAELMRFKATVSVTGTHGKTTTTSLIAHLFEQAGLDPTVITGGIINAWGSNARLGEGEWMVVEADESDGTFTRLPSQIGVVTNMDPEHLDYFGDVKAMHEAYRVFVENVPFYGLVIACIDHAEIGRMLLENPRRFEGRRILTYGLGEGADLRITGTLEKGGTIAFDAELGPRVPGGARVLSGLAIPVPGLYNALNGLAATAVALEAGIPDEAIRAGLASFSGVKRRFSRVGSWNGVAFYDDYAHHPREVTAVLHAARTTVEGRVIAVFQPHRYTRIQTLFHEFCNAFGDADAVIVTPVYSAGETPIAGIDHMAMVEGLKQAGHKGVVAVASEDELAALVSEVARPGDLVIALGAGSITEWIGRMPERLAAPPLRAGEAM